ncbi:MAG TPA: xanthine dehydrogenase family protein subunit M [Anaerolineales bacterium]|nr:xanthine dehydrogenase family protein subunit M [Anaerolineales bacterium]
MRPFDLHLPETLPEAVEWMTQLAPDGMAIAGGTDLLLKLRGGAISPKALVSLARLSELAELSFDAENGLRVGAGVTLSQLLRSPLIRQHYPVLCQAGSEMGSEQVRSIATVGGNLCNAAPSADLAPPLIALGSRAVIAGPSGERFLPLESFFEGPGKTALAPGELLKEVLIPPPCGRTIYLKHSSRTYMDIAVVGVAVQLAAANGGPQKVRIVLGAVAPTPIRALRAEAVLAEARLDAEGIEESARLAAQECAPIDDIRSSAWYRRRMVTVLVRRALSSMTDLASYPEAER